MLLRVARGAEGPSWRLLICLSLPILFSSEVAASRILTISLLGREERVEHADNESTIFGDDAIGKDSQQSHIGVEHANNGLVTLLDHSMAGKVEKKSSHAASGGLHQKPLAVAESSSGSSFSASLIQQSILSKLSRLVPEKSDDSWKLPIVLGASSVLALMLLMCLCFNTVGPSSNNKRTEHKHKGRVIYEWDQTPTMATIYIRPPPGLKKQDFDIVIQPHSLKVGRKGKAPFLKEPLHDEVDVHHSSWKLCGNGELQVYLQKAERAIWPDILQSAQPAPEKHSSLRASLT